ncbi:MAG: carbohydrate ABC transporter permease [Actinobacteria bacterium]|nr:carbohydrate ABC transporter permease [Actinomycetota bacterium]
MTTHEATLEQLAPPARRPFSLGRVLLFVLMIVVAIVMFYPFWFMISASFKTQRQFMAGTGFSLESWQKLLTVLPVGQQLLNSAIVCALSIAIIVAVSTLAGFAFAKLRYRASTLFFLLIIAAMLIPMQSIIIPAYVNISKVHLLTTYFGAVLVYAALGTPFATFLMTAYYRSLPDELIEAALVDGLGYWRIFQRIALPLSIPAIVTIIVLQVIQIWGDLLIGLLFLQNPAQRTITVGLGALSAGRVTEIPVLMAGSLVSAIPAVIVYLIFQGQLVKGLTAGISK